MYKEKNFRGVMISPVPCDQMLYGTTTLLCKFRIQLVLVSHIRDVEKHLAQGALLARRLWSPVVLLLARRARGRQETSKCVTEIGVGSIAGWEERVTQGGCNAVSCSLAAIAKAVILIRTKNLHGHKLKSRMIRDFNVCPWRFFVRSRGGPHRVIVARRG